MTAAQRQLGPVCTCGRRHLHARQYATCYERHENGLSPWQHAPISGDGPFGVYVTRDGRPRTIFLFATADEALDTKAALDALGEPGTVNLVRRVIP